MNLLEKPKIVVLCSGTGSNLVAIHNSIKNNIIIAEIVCVIINNKCAKSVAFCIDNNLNYRIIEYNKNNITRNEYDTLLIDLVRYHNPYLIVLAGWMHIVSKTFIHCFNNIINIHPALPGTFVGTNCIRKAYDSFNRGEIENTGVMVHEVIEEVDRGKVIEQIIVPINGNDTYEDLENRVKLYEKGVLISAIQKYVSKNNSEFLLKPQIYRGKVRDVENIGYNLLLLKASNRLSAFDRNLCNIPKKGVILNKISEHWFKTTKHIIDNHYLYSSGEMMIVKKCSPIKLEIIVRGYMTGSSNTSIWTHYKKGDRDIYGLRFKEGYIKNDKLDNIVITPTTKGITDHPITKEDIIKDYLTADECEFVYSKALELFKYGQKKCLEKGLILVDTKYEFGYYNNKIILMDELHTCDSSRFWLKDTYNDNIKQGIEPDKLDKDVVRDWVKTVCDPYNTSISIPNIPQELRNKVTDVYESYYNILTGLKLTEEDKTNISSLYLKNYFLRNINKNMVVILAGSVKDEPHIEAIKEKLRHYNIYSNNFYCSAHKETNRLLEILSEFEDLDKNIVYVTCAGMSNALSGVVACNTRHPVIACPVFKNNVDMTININSSLQCPSKVPVITTRKCGTMC